MHLVQLFIKMFWFRCRRIVVLSVSASHLPCTKRSHHQKLCVLSWILSGKQTHWSQNNTLDHTSASTGCHPKCRLWTTPSPNVFAILILKWPAGRPRTKRDKIWCAYLVVNCAGLQTFWTPLVLSLIHIWRCRRSTLCRSRWSPYH